MDTLIVCNNKIKEKMLLDLNDKPLINQTFMSKKEFIHNYYFDYNEETIYYLVDKYHYKYDVALEYLNNLYYVEDKDYKNIKLDMLVSLKQELDREGLLIYNKLFKNYLKNLNVIFYDELSAYDLRMIDELKSICKVTIKEKEIGNYEPSVYEFNTIDEEVEYVAFRICELIDQGISFDKIKLANITEDYEDVIRRIFKLYHLNIPEKNSLFGMNITKTFLSNYQSNIQSTIDLLKSRYDSHLVNKIVNIVNKYCFIDDYLKVKNLIIEDIKRTTITTNYNEQIEIIDYHNYIGDDYVFLMNFNEESIPKKYQDIDYIEDNIKPDYLENTVMKNNREKESVANFIKSTKNLIITYKLHTPFGHFYPSSMIDILSLKVVKESINPLVSYSKLANELSLCNMYDDYYKYGIINPNMSLLNSNYSLNYQDYSNKYTLINDDIADLVLSYTSMDSYYKCRFKYYLDRILKVDKDNNNSSKYIGSIFHYVLEKCLYSDLDYHKVINEYIQDKQIVLSIKEKFFLDKLVEQLPEIMDEIRNQDQYIKLDKRLFEEKVMIDFGDSKFVGVIDKVMYDNDYYAIIDYKTGKTDINIKNIKHGLGMQLPIYLYLAHKKFGGHIVGFYLNHILHGNIKYDLKKDYDKQYQDNLKLYGYSNTKYINEFDASYNDSKIIKSLKVKNDGNFYNYSKVLTNDEIEDMIELVEDKILECIDDIKERKFDINPKNINGKNVSCEYCPYSDICFKANEDVIYLKEDDQDA